MTQIIADRERFEVDGYCLVRDALTVDDVNWIGSQLEDLAHPRGVRTRNGTSFAIRDVFAASPELLRFVSSGRLRGLASMLLDGDARPTKATLFDKHADANWSLPLHQDLTITVRRRAEVAGYGPWTEKAGVPHVRPPESVLESIVGLRIHLDDCAADNGALLVVPGSHSRGRLASDAIASFVRSQDAIPVPARAGDVLAMRPLLFHGSAKAERPTRRRVLHVEFSTIELPKPLKWPGWASQNVSSGNV
jgi:hypothetical protein